MCVSVSSSEAVQVLPLVSTSAITSGTDYTASTSRAIVLRLGTDIIHERKTVFPSFHKKEVMNEQGATYQSAGVDLELYQESMSRIPKLMHRTFCPRVIKQDGGFAGLFQLDFANRLFARNYKEPVLVSGTDGVGTKLKVKMLNQLWDATIVEDSPYDPKNETIRKDS